MGELAGRSICEGSSKLRGRAKAILPAVYVAIAISSCALPDQVEPVADYARASLAPVEVDLRVRDNPDAQYRSVRSFTVPAGHKIGDGMFPYEGIGWENGFAGYRIYLDGRLVADIFGKQQVAPALADIGSVGSYHDLAPWGMDVLKVGPSLGIGGIGILRGGQPQQFGEIATLSATIDHTGPERGGFTIDATGLKGPGADNGRVTAHYIMGRRSPLTRVSVVSTANLPLATGIVMHEGAQLLQSGAENGRWQYVATWGDAQSENKDGLGMALFYRSDQAEYGGFANQTQFVTFAQPQFEYGFLAAWERDASGVKDRAAFSAMLERERQRLNREESK